MTITVQHWVVYRPQLASFRRGIPYDRWEIAEAVTKDGTEDTIANEEPAVLLEALKKIDL